MRSKELITEKISFLRIYFKLIIDYYIFKASLVQLVERRFPKPNAEGSSPSGRDFKN
jgi:hypothetical protein